MLRKKEVYTIITPIPSFIPRQLAIDILHSHSEVITLNPLVLNHNPIPAPRTAASDEYYSTWYEIIERIQWVPGMGRLGSGKISFTGCFHDMPWGLQTHIYAPMNVDLRIKYRIEGNQPGLEPPTAHMEMGLAALGAPADGLYLREDIEIRCNIAVVGFVKTQLKAASKEMVSRIIKKAELLDAGVLHAMFDRGKLRTINPNDRSVQHQHHLSLSSSPTSPTQSAFVATYRDPPMPASSMSPRMSIQSAYAGYQPPHSPSPGQTFARPATSASQRYPPAYAQSAYTQQQNHVTGTLEFPAEMPGDTFYPHSHHSQQQQSQQSSPQPSPALQPPNPYRMSAMSSWGGTSATESPRTSVSSEPSSSNGGQHSPGIHGGFTSELPVHEETQEEHHPQPEKSSPETLHRHVPNALVPGGGSANVPSSNPPPPPPPPKGGSAQKQQPVKQQLAAAGGYSKGVYVYNPQDYAGGRYGVPQ